MSEQIYVNDRSDRVVRCSQKWMADDNGRVVDEHFDRTQIEFHFDGQCTYLVADRYVHRVRLDRGLRDDIGDQSQRFVVTDLVHVHARQLGAQFGELYGQFTSQASARPRDLYGTK